MKSANGLFTLLILLPLCVDAGLGTRYGCTRAPAGGSGGVVQSLDVRAPMTDGRPGNSTQKQGAGNLTDPHYNSFVVPHSAATGVVTLQLGARHVCHPIGARLDVGRTGGVVGVSVRLQKLNALPFTASATLELALYNETGLRVAGTTRTLLGAEQDCPGGTPGPACTVVIDLDTRLTQAFAYVCLTANGTTGTDPVIQLMVDPVNYPIRGLRNTAVGPLPGALPIPISGLMVEYQWQLAIAVRHCWPLFRYGTPDGVPSPLDVLPAPLVPSGRLNADPGWGSLEDPRYNAYVQPNSTDGSTLAARNHIICSPVGANDTFSGIRGAAARFWKTQNLVWTAGAALNFSLYDSAGVLRGQLTRPLAGLDYLCAGGTPGPACQVAADFDGPRAFSFAYLCMHYAGVAGVDPLIALAVNTAPATAAHHGYRSGGTNTTLPVALSIPLSGAGFTQYPWQAHLTVRHAAVLTAPAACPVASIPGCLQAVCDARGADPRCLICTSGAPISEDRLTCLTPLTGSTGSTGSSGNTSSASTTSAVSTTAAVASNAARVGCSLVALLLPPLLLLLLLLQ